MTLLQGSRQPFVGLALSAGAGIVIADLVSLPQGWLGPALIALGVGGLLLCWKPNSAITYGWVIAAFLLLHQLRTTHTAGLALARELGERPRVITVIGSVVSEPKIGENGASTCLVQLAAIQLEGRSEPNEATILVRWKGAPAFGDEVRLFGLISPIDPPRNPGEFDMRSYLARRDVRRALFVRYPEDGAVVRQGGGNLVLRLAQQSRRWLQSTLCRGLDDSPDVRDFISGITLGLRHQTPEDIEEPFQQTGTLHLFAVAGLHVGIVADLLWMVASVCGLPRRVAAIAIIPLVLFYSAVTGFHISSIRAAVMSAVFLGAFVVERRAFSLNGLAAAAVLLLCWNTNELFSTGFQLSFAVVTMIVLVAAPLTELFRRTTAPDPLLPRPLLPRYRKLLDSVLLKLSQGLSVSVAAWLGSLVLLFWYFHLITPVSLLANLVVVPVAFLILAVALLSIIFAPILPWVSLVFNNANWFLANLVIAIVHLFARVPGAYYYLPHPPGLGTAAARLTALDVGTGAAVHLQTRRQDWLLDCGSQRNYDRVVRPYLHSAGVNRVDAVLLSHGDSQHIAGAFKLVSETRRPVVIDNPAADRSIVHKRLRQLLQDHRLMVTHPIQGSILTAGAGVNCSVLFPPAGFRAQMSDDQTFVLQLTVQNGPRVLLMSDSGWATEKALLSLGDRLRSDIIIKGQHHSGNSGSAEFLDAVRPRLIVATSRDFPQHERVEDQWAEELVRRNIKLFRQDETGAVEIELRSDRWEARAYFTGEIFRSRNR